MERNWNMKEIELDDMQYCFVDWEIGRWYDVEC